MNELNFSIKLIPKALPGELMDREILEIGESIPEFKAPSTSGTIASEDLDGKWSVLYFFPKSFTPGCTTQSCSLRDGYSNFDQKNINLLYFCGLNQMLQR